MKKKLYNRGGKKPSVKKNSISKKLLNNVSISPSGIGLKVNKNIKLSKNSILNMSANRPIIGAGINPGLVRGQANANLNLNSNIGPGANLNLDMRIPQQGSPSYGGNLNMQMGKNFSGNIGAQYSNRQLSPSANLTYRKRFNYGGMKYGTGGKMRYEEGGMYDQEGNSVSNIVYEQSDPSIIDQYEKNLDSANAANRSWRGELNQQQQLADQKVDAFRGQLQNFAKLDQVQGGVNKVTDFAKNLFGKGAGPQAQDMGNLIGGSTDLGMQAMPGFTPMPQSQLLSGQVANPNIGASFKPQDFGPLQTAPPGPGMGGQFSQESLMANNPLMAPPPGASTAKSFLGTGKSFAETGVGGKITGALKNPMLYTMGAQLAGRAISGAADDHDPTTFTGKEKAGRMLSEAGNWASMGSALGPLGTLAGGIGGAIYGAASGKKQQRAALAQQRQHLKRKGVGIQNLAMAQGQSKEYSGYDMGVGYRQGGPRMYQNGGAGWMDMLKFGAKKAIPKAAQYGANALGATGTAGAIGAAGMGMGVAGGAYGILKGHADMPNLVGTEPARLMSEGAYGNQGGVQGGTFFGGMKRGGGPRMYEGGGPGNFYRHGGSHDPNAPENTDPYGGLNVGMPNVGGHLSLTDASGNAVTATPEQQSFYDQENQQREQEWADSQTANAKQKAQDSYNATNNTFFQKSLNRAADTGDATMLAGMASGNPAATSYGAIVGKGLKTGKWLGTELASRMPWHKGEDWSDILSDQRKNMAFSWAGGAPGIAGPLAKMSKLAKGKQYVDKAMQFVNKGYKNTKVVKKANNLLQKYIMPSLTTNPLAQNRTGGMRSKYLQGGVAKSLPGGAVKFEGRSHEQGGILLDPMTEVEGGETMDKVNFGKGGKKDYFFSKFLKLGGRSFAQRHEGMVKSGASQSEIDGLANMQEKISGRKKFNLGGERRLYSHGGKHDENTDPTHLFEDLNDIKQQLGSFTSESYDLSDEEKSKYEQQVYNLTNQISSSNKLSSSKKGLLFQDNQNYQNQKQFYDSLQEGIFKDIDRNTPAGNAKYNAIMNYIKQDVIGNKDNKKLADKFSSQFGSNSKDIYRLLTKSSDLSYNSDFLEESKMLNRNLVSNFNDDTNNINKDMRTRVANNPYISIDPNGNPVLNEIKLRDFYEKNNIQITEKLPNESLADYHNRKNPIQESTDVKEDIILGDDDNNNNEKEIIVDNSNNINTGSSSGLYNNIQQGDVDPYIDEIKALTGIEDFDFNNQDHVSNLQNILIGGGAGENAAKENEAGELYLSGEEGDFINEAGERSVNRAGVDGKFGTDTFEALKLKLGILDKNILDESEIKKEVTVENDPNATTETTDTGDINMDYKKPFPWHKVGTGLAMGLQMLPAIAAMRDKPDYMAPAGRMPKTQLDRVRYEDARAANQRDYRGMGRFIEQSGLGPGGIAAKMAAYSKKQAGDQATDAQEKRQNAQIANQEAGMDQRAAQINIKNNMDVNKFNTGARAATKDRKLAGLDTMVKNVAGINKDLLAYKSQKDLANAIGGNTGVNQRFWEVEAAFKKANPNLKPGSIEYNNGLTQYTGYHNQNTANTTQEVNDQTNTNAENTARHGGMRRKSRKKLTRKKQIYG